MHKRSEWKMATKRQNGVRTVMMPTGTPDLNIRIADVLSDTDAAFIVKAANSHADLVAALRDVDMRTVQARIASGIGREPATKRVAFLLGELERIRGVACAALEKAGVTL
jgi:hypothetical protein